MAATLDPQQSTESGFRDSSRPTAGSRRGLRIFFTLLCLAGLAAVSVYGFSRLPEFTSSSDETGLLTYTVAREDMLVAVTEDGNAESARNLDVKCQVAGGGTILWIVEEGKFVNEGDELVRLDTANILEQLSVQKIAVEQALATKIQAQENYEAAEIAVREYEEGTFVEELKLAESGIRIAQENLRSAQNVLEYSKRMVRKGFATPLQLEADQFAVERSQLELEAADTRKKVLVNFTREKMLKELVAAREAAAAKARSDQAAFDLESARLQRLQQQLENCVITAPQQGMVIYANEQSRRRSNQEAQIQEGAVVREGQAIIRLPDLSRMQVRVTVHESRVDEIKIGMPARLEIQGKSYDGEVISVANQPEPGSWFSASVKEYATVVSIADETSGIRPGQTAHVEIVISDLKNILTVPVSAVVVQRDRYYCWLQTPKGPERRELKLGQTNDRSVEVIDGVKEGDIVIRNPRAVVEEARQGAADMPASGEVAPEESSSDVENGGESGTVADPSGEASPESSAETAPNAAGGDVPTGGAPRADLMQYDTDGDKRISKAEAPERMQSFFDNIDTDGDGYMSTAEIAAMRARLPNTGEAPGGRP